MDKAAFVDSPGADSRIHLKIGNGQGRTARRGARSPDGARRWSGITKTATEAMAD